MVAQRQPDLCPRCGGALIGDFDFSSLRVLPVCINCGRSPAQAPRLTVAQAHEEITSNLNVFPSSRVVRIPTITDSELLTTAEVSTDYQVSCEAVGEAKRDGHLPNYGSASRPRYKREDVEQWREWCKDFRLRRVETMLKKRNTVAR